MQVAILNVRSRCLQFPLRGFRPEDDGAKRRLQHPPCEFYVSFPWARRWRNALTMSPSSAAEERKAHAGDVQDAIAVLHCNEKKATQRLEDSNSNVQSAIELGLAQDNSNEACPREVHARGMPEGHQVKGEPDACDSPIS